MLRKGAVKETVLVFVFDRALGLLLMILKKRGQGAGKVNVPGGKLLPGESSLAAAARECAEETGLRPLALQEAGRLEFSFPENDNWDNNCVVYTAEAWTGSLVPENEECSAYWENLQALPLERMWDADRRWLPLLLSGKPFHRVYVFDREDRVKEEKDLLTSSPGKNPG